MASAAASPSVSAPASASLSHPRPLLPSPPSERPSPPHHIQMTSRNSHPEQSPNEQLQKTRPTAFSGAADDPSSSAKPSTVSTTIPKDRQSDVSRTRLESSNESLIKDAAPKSSTTDNCKAEILKDVSNASVDAAETVNTDSQEFRVSKATWQKPLASPEDQRPPPPVLGAFVWPALAETRNIKSSQVKNHKDLGLNATNAHPSKEPKYGSVSSFNDVPANNRTKQSLEKPNTSLEGSYPGNNRPNSSGFATTNASVKHDSKTRSVSSFSEHQVQYHRNDSSSNNVRKWRNNNNNNRDYGKGNQGWHHHGRSYENGNDMPVILHEQRIGPRNMPRPAHPTFLNVNSGFYHPVPFPNGSMYYVPPGMPNYVPNSTYFPPVGFSPGIMHGPDQNALRSMLLKQIEYYFSVENLCKDIFLRSNMDERGFVPLSLIASFNRVQMLSTDPNMILDALQHSSVVEVQYDRVRRREDWKKWVLNSAQMNNVREENFTVRDEAERKRSASEPEVSVVEVPDRVTDKSASSSSSMPFDDELNWEGSMHDQQSSLSANAPALRENYTTKSMTDDPSHSESIFTLQREPEDHLGLNNKETNWFINVSHAEHGSVISVP